MINQIKLWRNTIRAADHVRRTWLVYPDEVSVEGIDEFHKNRRLLEVGRHAFPFGYGVEFNHLWEKQLIPLRLAAPDTYKKLQPVFKGALLPFEWIYNKTKAKYEHALKRLTLHCKL